MPVHSILGETETPSQTKRVDGGTEIRNPVPSYGGIRALNTVCVFVRYVFEHRWLKCHPHTRINKCLQRLAVPDVALYVCKCIFEDLCVHMHGGIMPVLFISVSPSLNKGLGT